MNSSFIQVLLTRMKLIIRNAMLNTVSEPKLYPSIFLEKQGPSPSFYDENRKSIYTITSRNKKAMNPNIAAVNNTPFFAVLHLELTVRSSAIGVNLT